ncbi:hypothetical protein H3C61_02275 [Candidatus Gracilibacteria bacterium]|nr:hypothetical protein [Candidatus Gracilibacteria bacterium]
MDNIQNSLTFVNDSKTKKERLIGKIKRDLKKIGNYLNIDDPLLDMLKDLSKKTKNNYNSIEDLDEITLEGLSNNLTSLVFEICEKVKKDMGKIIEKEIL